WPCASRGEQLAPPRRTAPCEAEAFVEAVGTCRPELERIRDQHESSPVWRAWNFAIPEAGFHRSIARAEDRAARQRLALVRRPRRQSRFTRSRGKISVRCCGGESPNPTFDPNLALDLG